jgi:hypothetical protein
VLGVFVAWPWLAFVVAAGCVLAGARLAAALWVAYGLYEYAMYARILCSGECNIRVDLLLLYPALLVATVAGVVRAVRRRRGGARFSKRAGGRP